jgi:endonuclease/exonuclease/phosphatase family metal-dependent hydrolase
MRPAGAVGLPVIGGTLLLMTCSPPAPDPTEPIATPAAIRIATFNIRELTTEALEDVDPAGVGQAENVRAAAEIIARIRPDVLVIQEIDHDYRSADDLALNGRRLRDAYLVATDVALDYPYVFAAPCNTGILSGHDLNGDGRIATEDDIGTREFGEDCYGFGTYPGQYSMVLLSRFPIDAGAARTFQRFLWKDLPNRHLPEGFYDPAEVDDFRLSSKSHWDVPVELGTKRLHLWISHPTPAVFDGDEDRNGRRNYDEIAFWRAYLDGDSRLYDDAGTAGGYSSDRSFVVIGDLNSDPRSDNAFYDGRQSIDVLLTDPRLRDTVDVCVGEGPEKPTATAAFGGGLRVDYLLPSAEVSVIDGGVYWPAVATDRQLATEASDHRLVWIDIDVSTLK